MLFGCLENFVRAQAFGFIVNSSWFLQIFAYEHGKSGLESLKYFERVAIIDDQVVKDELLKKLRL